jgi:Putative prokaryotic signal transducing protein
MTSEREAWEGGMREAYRPANAAEAHMLAHLLGQSGIEAHIHGEALQGAAGELPAGNLIQLLVADEEHERARALLMAWERVNVPAEPSARPGRRFGIVAALVFLAVGTVAGWALKLALDKSRFSFADSIVGLDQNEDGRDDITWRYRLGSETAYKTEMDVNFDGEIDTITHLDAVGVPTEEEWDADYDGVFDSHSTFRAGIRGRTEADTDGNGIADVVSMYESGALAREEITDHLHGHVVRVNHYNAFRLQRSEIDLDRNGSLETLRTFDRFGEVTSTQMR